MRPKAADGRFPAAVGSNYSCTDFPVPLKQENEFDKYFDAYGNYRRISLLSNRAQAIFPQKSTDVECAKVTLLN